MSNIQLFLLDATSWNRILYSKNEELAKYLVNNKPLRFHLPEALKKASEALKKGESAVEVTEAIKNNQWQKAGKGGTAFLKVMDMGLAVAAGFGAVMGQANAEAIKDIVDVNTNIFDAINAEANRNFDFIRKIEARVSGVEKGFELLTSDVQTTGLRAQQAFTNSVNARELAERGVNSASGALTKIDRVERNLIKRIKPLEVNVNGFVKQINAKILQISSSVDKLINQVRKDVQTNIQSTVKQVQSNLNQQEVQIKRLDNQIQNIQKVQPINKQEITEIASNAAVKVAESVKTELRTENQIIRFDLKQLETNFTYAQNANEIKDQSLLDQDKVLAGGIASLGKEIDILKILVKEPSPDPAGQAALDITRNLQKQIADFKLQQTEIQKEQQKQAEKLKEQDKLNREGLDILKLLPLAIGRVDDRARLIDAKVNQVPVQTVQELKPQIPPLVEQGICNSANNGCLNGALSNTAQNIGDITNKAANDLWGKINTGLNALNLAANAPVLQALDAINGKLGEQIPNGGIAGKLSRGFKWLQLDKVMALMTFALTLHNALMLSSSLKDSAIGVIETVLQVVGLKDEDGNAFDLNSIINSSVEGFVKSLIGAENYAQLSANLVRVNRIYQSVINAANSIQNLTSTVLSGLEYTAGNINSIGNALKSAGAVFENAYNWLNPSPNFDNPWFRTLEGADNILNTAQLVAQIPLDVSNAVTEVNQSGTELIKSIKGEEEDAKQGIAGEIPDYKKLKQQQEEKKARSMGISIDLTQIFNSEG